MTPKNFDTIRISSSEELKKHLFGVDSTVVIPEFKNVLEFTRDELNELKRQLESKSDNEVFIIIEAAIAKKARATLDTKKVAAVGLTSMQTEQLKQNVGEKSPEKTRQGMVDSQNKEISTIDVTKSFEKQEDKIRTLDTGLYILLQHLAVSGIKKEELSNISNFEKILTENSSKLDSSMRVVSAKILEIFKNGSPELKNYYTSKWVGLVSNIYPNARNIGEISRSMREGKTIPQGNSIMEFAKEHPIMASVIAVAGTYGIFKVLGGLFGGDSKTEGSKTGEKGFLGGVFDKITGPWKVAIAGILGVFGLGKALELDGVKKFFQEKLGFNIDENRITKALQLISDGKIWEAIKTIFSGVETKLSDDGLKSLGETIKTETKSDFEIDKDILKGVMKKDARDFIVVGGSAVSSIFRFFKEKGKDIIGWSNEDNKHENAIRDFLKSKVKESDIKKGETVEDVVLRLYPNYAKTAQKTNPDGSSSSIPAGGAAAIAGTGAVLGATAKGSEKKEGQEEQKDGKLEWSVGAPVFFYWLKGKRFELGKYFSSWAVRQRIEGIEKEGLGINKNKDLIKEYSQLEQLLNKTELSTKEIALREKLFHKFVSENPKAFEQVFHNVKIDSLIKNPEQLSHFRKVSEELRLEAENYNKEIIGLTQEKRRIASLAESEMRKANKNSKDGIIDSAKKIFRGDDLSEVGRIRSDALRRMKDIDSEIIARNSQQGAKVKGHLLKVEHLYDKYAFDNTTRQKASKAIFGNLSHLGVVVDNGISKLPIAGKVYSTGKLGLKVGFLGFGAYTVAKEWGTEAFKYDATELSLGLLPVTSEILDFKAAITGHDLAGRNLKGTDRAIRFGFGVVGTIADAAALVTFGQSEWVRGGLAVAKGAKTTGKVAEVTKDAVYLNKLKNGLFMLGQSAKGEKILALSKIGNTAGKVFTFASLGIATYEVAHDILGDDYKSGAKEIAKNTENHLKEALKAA